MRQRLHDADRVAEAQAVGALGLGGGGVLEQEAELGAARVLGVDRDVDALALRERDGLADRVRTHARSFMQLGLDVDVARRKRDGHARRRRSRCEVLMSATFARFQPRTEALQPQVRDLLDDLALVAAHDGDAGLDLVRRRSRRAYFAIWTFSALVKTTPAVCSPSRRVVSSSFTCACRDSSRPAVPRSSCVPRGRTSCIKRGPERELARENSSPGCVGAHEAQTAGTPIVR